MERQEKRYPLHAMVPPLAATVNAVCIKTLKLIRQPRTPPAPTLLPCSLMHIKISSALTDTRSRMHAHAYARIRRLRCARKQKQKLKVRCEHIVGLALQKCCIYIYIYIERSEEKHNVFEDVSLCRCCVARPLPIFFATHRQRLLALFTSPFPPSSSSSFVHNLNYSITSRIYIHEHKPFNIITR